jgi:hypothetical protein
VQGRNDGRSVLCHLPVGEAENPKPEALKVGVAGAVGLERGPIAVVAEAVGLDDQPAVPPEEVHFVPAYAGVHLRLGKAVAATEAQEDSLELAAGEVGLAPDVAELTSRRSSARLRARRKTGWGEVR